MGSREGGHGCPFVGKGFSNGPPPGGLLPPGGLASPPPGNGFPLLLPPSLQPEGVLCNGHQLERGYC